MVGVDYEKERERQLSLREGKGKANQFGSSVKGLIGYFSRARITRTDVCLARRVVLESFAPVKFFKASEAMIKVIELFTSWSAKSLVLRELATPCSRREDIN